MIIILKPDKSCKCFCRRYKDKNGKYYWYNIKTHLVYLTDCHEENPILAKGKFKILDK